MNKGFVAILILILVAAAALGGYLIYQNQSKPPSPQPSPTSDTAANWKTYTNTKYGFSFKHPNLISGVGIGWPLTGDPERIIVLAEKDSVVEESDVPFNGFAISIEPNTRNFSLEQYVFIEAEAVKSHYTCAVFKGIENIDVNSIKGVRITCEENHGFLDEFVFMFPDTKQILIFARLSKTKGSFEATFNKILSTFKFTN